MVIRSTGAQINEKFHRLVLPYCIYIAIAILLCSCVAKPTLKADQVEITPSIKPTEWIKEATNTIVLDTTSTIPVTKFLLAVTETTAPSEPTPDVIFYSGVILTMEDDQPNAQALAIRDDKIIAVGSDTEVLSLQSPQTILINLDGQTIMPGFVDAHSHLFNATNSWGLDLQGAQQLALEYGITTLGNMYADPAFVEQMAAFDRSGTLKIRTSLYLNYNSNCGEIFGDWYLEYPATFTPGEMLRVDGVKIFTDGGSCGAPAVSYEHPAYGYGDLWFTEDDFNAVLLAIHTSGRQAAIHALGDRAVEQALNGIEFILAGRENILRHRIEHIALVREDQLDRYSQIGVVPLIFGSYPICDPAVSPPPSEQNGWEWRWRELVDHNPDLHFAWHSDMHTRLFAQISPLQHLYSMVTPFEVASDGETKCETPSWVAEKTLHVDEALAMMTIEAAFALFREQEVGSLRPGKFADLLILSGNPLEVDPTEIIDIKVLVTMVGGQVVYCTAEAESLCFP